MKRIVHFVRRHDGTQPEGRRHYIVDLYTGETVWWGPKRQAAKMLAIMGSEANKKASHHQHQVKSYLTTGSIHSDFVPIEKYPVAMRERLMAIRAALNIK